ncbi:MAG: FUSC family membrane protein, partial [Candidatus Korobacteraceae bacterium]
MIRQPQILRRPCRFQSCHCETAGELGETKFLRLTNRFLFFMAPGEKEQRLGKLESTMIRAAHEEHPNAWLQQWRKVVHFDHGRMEPWIALRNTIGVTVPLMVGIALGMPLGGLAVSSGALQVSYSDGHGPYAQRAKQMLTATLLCAVAVVAGGLVGENRFLAVIVPSLWAFAAGLGVCIGPTAEGLGVISLVTLIIYSAQPLSPEIALLSGVLALGGGLLQAALALMLWPVRRYQPERRVLADLYNQLSSAAIVPTGPEGGPPASEQSTVARETLAGLGNDNSLEAERYWSLLNQAERIRLSLLTLRRLRKRMERDAEVSSRVDMVQRFLDVSADVLAKIGESLSMGEA